MLVSQREAVRERLSNTFSDTLQAEWIINQNYPIIMPPYDPIKLKTISPFTKKTPQVTQQFKSLPKDVPLSLQDIDTFQSELHPQDLHLIVQRYIGSENVEPLISALTHEGPNYEENRKYLSKLKEYFKLKWKKEEVAPSRLIPLSLRELLSILLLRSQFSFIQLASKLLDLIRITNSQNTAVQYEQACIFIEQLCRRLMIPIPGFQLRNWIQSALFSHSPQIIKATLISHNSQEISSSEVDVTSLLQKYLNFCQERTGSRVLFLPGLSALSEFKSAIKKVKPPRLLVLNFSTVRGSINSEAFIISSQGSILQKQSLGECFIWNSYFSLESVREHSSSLDSLLTIPFLSDWLRMEVSLNSTKSTPNPCSFSLEVRVEKADKTFYFSAGIARVLQLPQANIQHISQKCELGELLQVDTLSDIRFRIRRYFYHTQDLEQFKEMESYVFTNESAHLIVLNQFTPLGRMLAGLNSKIILNLNYPRERATIRRKSLYQTGLNGYALFINGDGTSSFKKCKVEQERQRRPGDEELYRIYYRDKVELRTRKEIILKDYDRRGTN